MRVLITRTADDSIATAKALAVLGHEAIIAPLRERITLDTPVPDGPFDAVLATSRHAFGPLPAALATLPCFCVGEKTAAAARASGFQQAQALGGDGAAMARHLLHHLKPGARLLYLAGQPRHGALENALGASSLAPVVMERYAMRRSTHLPDTAREALLSGQIDAVLHYSRESARTYLALATQAALKPAALTPLQLCLSAAVADVFRAEVPESRLRIAASPNEAMLLRELAL